MNTMRNATCVILLCAGGLLSAQEGEPTDLDRMQGTWVVVSLIERAKAVPADEAEAIEIVIDKDTYTAFEKGKMVVKYRVKLDATKTPKEIDFTYLVGDDKGKTEPGIYAFDKDKLTFMLDEDKKGRPKTFEGKESYSTLVLKKKPK